MAALVMLSAAVVLGLFLPSSMADNVLYGGDRLNTGESLTEGNFKFIMQSDCNLVLFDNDKAVWSSETNGLGNSCFARMQTDGNFVIFNNNFNKVWSSDSGGSQGKYILVLQSDGKVVIYACPIWTIPKDELTNRKIAMVTKN